MTVVTEPFAATAPGGVACRDCALRRLGVFRAVSADQIAFIQDFKERHVHLPAGRLIVREADRAEMLTLYRGWAFRFKTLSDGRRQILNFLLPGDLIGLQDQVSEVSPHGVEALTDVEYCRFRGDRLWDLFRHHPSLGYDVTWLAAHEETMIDENLLSVGRRTAVERIAVLLMHLYKRAVSLGMERDGRVPFPINQQHVSDAIGLSLVHTHRTLRRLHKLGLYELRDGWLALPRPSALERLAEYYDAPVPSRPLI